MEQKTREEAQFLFNGATALWNELQTLLQPADEVAPELRHFAADCCDPDPAGTVQGSVLYTIYQRWAADKRRHNIDVRHFASNQFGNDFQAVRKRDRGNKGSTWQVRLTALGLDLLTSPNNAGTATAAVPMQS
jgi:hypothetical protein